MNPNIFQSRQAREIITYIREEYGDELEFLWPKFSRNAIWRNQQNRKWYAALLVIPKSKLGITTNTDYDEEVEILDIRFDKNEALDFARSHEHIYPGYHMNKNNWITIILNGSLDTAQIIDLINHSYKIAANK